MEIVVTAGAAEADAFAFAVFDPPRDLPDLDPRLAGLAEAGEISGAASSTCVLHQDGGRKIIAAGRYQPVSLSFLK